MRAALRAASAGAGRVSPNPLVGAALEVPGRSRRSAAHLRFGGPHAEARLLDRAIPVGRLPRGSILYVTLEPCCHHGKTPPCVDRILAARPSRIVIATLDPDPRVRGRGAARLRQAGIAVEIGPGEEEALALNLAFHVRQQFGRASVLLKLAASLDARLGRDGHGPRWVTGAEARRRVHLERARCDAVLVGSGTVLRDAPELTVRAVRGPDPSRIVVDSKLRVPVRGRLWRAWRERSGVPPGRPAAAVEGNRTGSAAGAGAGTPAGAQEGAAGFARCGNYLRASGSRMGRYRRSARLILATGRDRPQSRLDGYREAGWEVWELPQAAGRVSLRALAGRAAREGFLRLLAEAGPGLAGALLEADLVDEISLYVASAVFGGRQVWPEAARRRPLERAFQHTEQRRVGEDLWIGLRRRGLLDRLRYEA